MLSFTTFLGYALFTCLAVILAKILTKTCKVVYRVFLCSNPTFQNTDLYGSPVNTWVLVTGATDGLGWEYCRQFAAMDYNIVLVSRTMSKLQERASALENEFKVQTSVIQADFSNCMSDPQFFKNLDKKISDLEVDIGIVVNNVGQLTLDIEKTSDESTISMN